MRKIYDAEYLRVESLNIKLKEENERLLFGRDTYVREQVDRTVDFYKEQLNQEKRTVEFQQDLTSGLEQLIDSVKTCLNAATQNQLRTPETQKVCAYLEACNALLLRLRAP
jgi:prefoldin subunit 5